jgi:tryptophan synthase alpha chain
MRFEMRNAIDNVFARGGGIRLMTHVVAGYPDLDTSVKLVRVMEACGVDMVEIQIPFSDPMADGPTIMRANQAALDGGMVPERCFDMAQRLTAETRIPILLMTYFNIPFVMGIDRFIQASRDAGASGLIIPDVPVDEADNGYYDEALKNNIHAIRVISPGVRKERATRVLRGAGGFVYVTLKTGTTGSRRVIGESGLAYLDEARSYTGIPIAAGFGISSPDHIRLLRGKADMAVIGSRVIEILDQSGIEGVRQFLQHCRTVSNENR